MIQVLEVCESYGGGVKKHVDYLYKYLDKAKYQAYFLVSGARDNAIVPDGYIQEDALSAYKNPLMILKSIVTISHLVRRKHIQLIHAHSTIAAVLVYLFTFFSKQKVTLVYTPHAYLSEKKLAPLKKRIILFVEQLYIKRYDCVINVSNQERQHALSHHLSGPEKQIVIKNGIVSETAPYTRKNIKHVVNIARCDKQKNPFEFIEIANKLKMVNDLDFTFVGGGELLEDCRRRVQRMKLTKVQFVGFSEDVKKWLKEADLFLSTSLYEGLPFSVIEAEAAGLPILLSNVVGHKELYKDNGHLYESGEAADAASWIKKVRSDTDLLEQYSLNSMHVFDEEYTLGTMIDKIENVYSGGIHR